MAKEEDAGATKVEEVPTTALQENDDAYLSAETLIGIDNMPGAKRTTDGTKEEEEEEALLESDLKRLKAAQEESEIQEETAPSVDEDIEIFKKVLYAEQVPITAELEHYTDMPSEGSLRKESVTETEKAAMLEDEKASVVSYEATYSRVMKVITFC